MAEITIKELIELKEILSSDSISTTRLTTNDNFKKLRRGLIALIDTLQVNEGPNVSVTSVEAEDIVANSFATPLPRDGVYNFRVNSNGEIYAKSLYANTSVHTPRLRLEPDPTITAFQAGEIRWSGTDWLGWNGTEWVSLSAGAPITITGGPLVINQLYEIVAYAAGDDFTNVGATTNVTGEVFVATGTTPAVWTNGSVLASDNGEVNTMANIGTGIGVYDVKVGAEFKMKSLSGVSGIIVDDTTDPGTIRIGALVSGVSGYSGISGFSGVSTSGFSGFSGIGVSGFSGESGFSGVSGKGVSGYSGVSGFSGATGDSGFSGLSGYSGVSGKSGVSGYSGFSGSIGDSGFSGQPGTIGTSGFSGEAGSSGFSGYSGLSGVGSSVIGNAEDGTYLDGLFTDFIPSTPIGTAVDRFNEVLKFLAPPAAPDLSDWDESTLALSVAGKLSFDTANPIGGYTAADTAPSPVYVDQLFDVTGKRLGITQAVGGTDMSGILASNVATGPGSPTPAYAANSFGDADQGDLKIWVNGTELITKRIDLTSSTGAMDTTSGGTTSGLTVSAQSPSYFPSGDPLASFQNRTGTWRVEKSDLTNGYNYIEVTHEIGVDIRTVARHEVVVDDDTTATSYSGESLFSPTFGLKKKLSGIEYVTSGTALYSVLIDNAYRNTYSSSASAITHTGSSNSYGVVLTAAAQALPANLGNEAAGVSIIAKVATFASNIRVIDETISLSTSTLRTVQGTVASPGASLSGFLFDNIAASSTLLVENFDDETYRLNTNSSYDAIADVTAGANIWDSTQSLGDGSAGHTDGMQVIGGKLIYPGNNVSFPDDFRTTAINFSTVWNDGGTGGSARDYSALIGSRVYIRKFRQLSPTTANFIMTINGSGGTFVSAGTALTGNNIHVHIKGPTETGWMDAYDDFVPGNWADDDGARDATNGTGRAFGTAWGLTIGTKNTANTGGYIVVRITVGASFTGEFSGINWTFA